MVEIGDVAELVTCPFCKGEIDADALARGLAVLEADHGRKRAVDGRAR